MTRQKYTPPLLPLGALAAGFGLAHAALAQTTADTVLPVVRALATAEPTAKDSVQATTTRIGKTQQELRDVPQSVTVVTERLIDDRNLETLKDALKNTGGISFLAAEGGEEDIRLRGFSLQASGDIFIDGIRDPAFYERDSFNWDRLEVLRGSASMLFGRGSTGGAVNQVSKLPTLFQTSDVSVTLGSGQYLRGTADLNLKTGENAALRINAMTTLAENDGAATRKAGIAPSFRWGIGTTNEFLVGLYALENRNGIDYGLPWLQGQMLPDVPAGNYYGMASDVALGSARHVTLGWVHRFADRSEWRTTFRQGRFDRDQRASAVRIAPAELQPGGEAITLENFGPDTVLRRSNGTGVQAKIQDLDTLTLQSDVDTKFNAIGLSHSVQAGMDYTADDFNGYASSNPASGPLLKPNTTVGTPNDGAWIDESLRLVAKNREFQSDAIGLYAQDLMALSPTWKLLAGLRWDRFGGDYWLAESTSPGGVVTPEALRSRSDSVWSERFGLLYQPTPLSSFHFSYGTSFNTSGDAYQYDALGSNTPPEKSRNIELGAKLDSASGAATLRLALFHSTKYNERNRDEDTVNAINYVLSGQRHAAGVEVDVAGRLTPDWEAYLSYAWIPDAEVDKASSVSGTTLIGERVGQRPGLTPKHSGTVWTTYRLTPKWRLGGGVTFRSKDSPQQSTIVAPGFGTVDLMAEYDAGPMQFKLNLANAADKAYADMLYRGHYIAGDPRTLQFTTTVKF
jgi:catecholate siderophore receptor